MNPDQRKKLGLGGDLSKQSVDQIIQGLKGGDTTQQGAALLLGDLRSNLVKAHGNMSDDLGIKKTDEEKKNDDKKDKEASLANAKDKLQTTKGLIVSTTQSNLTDGIKETAALGVYDSYFIGDRAAKTVLKNYINDTYETKNGERVKKEGARSPDDNEKRAIETLYKNAANGSYVFNQKQLDLIGTTAGEVTRDYLNELTETKEPLPSKNDLARILSGRLADQLKKAKTPDGKTLDDLGTPVATINAKNSPFVGPAADTLGKVVSGFGQAIAENKEGTYNQLAHARKKLEDANKVYTQSLAAASGVEKPVTPSEQEGKAPPANVNKVASKQR
jgi:hypothetical protein